jgi:membrane protease YdiL (CAAX protease family)
MSQSELSAPIMAPASGRPARPGRDLVLDLIIIALGFLAISIIIPIIFIVIHGLSQGTDFQNLGKLQQTELLRLVGVDGIFTLLLVQNLFFALLPTLRVIWLRHEPPANIGFQFQRPLRLIAIGIGMGVVVLISNALLSSAFAALGIRQNQAAQYPLFRGDYLGQALFLLGAAILAPLGEEILFRGYIFKTLQKIWGNKSWGLLGAYAISSLLFAFAHSAAATEGILGLLVPTFVMGLLLAWCLHRTGSLVPCVIAHSLNNGIALLSLLACVNGAVACPGF